MRVAAFDLSSRTGLAHWEPGMARPRLRTKKLVGYDYRVEDTLELWRLFLGSYLREARPQIVVIEEFVAAMYEDAKNPDRVSVNGQAILRLAGLSTFTRWCCKMAGAKVVIATAGQWRKHVFGSARHNGTDWKVRAKQRVDYLGWEYDSHDAAEAGLILDYGIVTQAKLNPPWRDDALMATST